MGDDDRHGNSQLFRVGKRRHGIDQILTRVE